MPTEASAWDCEGIEGEKPVKAARKQGITHRNNVIHVPEERWGRAKRLSTPPTGTIARQRSTELHYLVPDHQGCDIFIPEPRPAMRGQMLNPKSREARHCFILIKEVDEILDSTDPDDEIVVMTARWIIAILPYYDHAGIGNPDADPALRLVEERGWLAIRSDGIPHLFPGAMNTSEIWRNAIEWRADVAKTMPECRSPEEAYELLLLAKIELQHPLTRE